jgi:hypothetical protein
MPMSSDSDDDFTKADRCVPAYVSAAREIGKLASDSGTGRPLIGLVFGLGADGKPILWAGEVAQAIAMSKVAAQHFPGGSLAKSVDAGATSDLSETLLDGLADVDGDIAAVYFDVTGTTLAASGTSDYKTMTLYKRDGAGGSAEAVATADTKTTAFTQWTSVAFTIDATKSFLLSTDLLTLSESHGGNGAIIPAGKLRVIRKAGH